MTKFKPKCKLIGEDGNIFNLIAIARQTLISLDMKDDANEMQEKVFKSKSYEDALNAIGEYVEIV